jgi:two-component system response regulator AgrA
LEIIINRIIEKNQINGKIVLKADNPYTVQEFLKNNKANLFIIDIDLKVQFSGLELAKEIREKINSVYIVFVTAHLEFVFNSFKVKPFDFLPKPVTEEIIEQCIKDVYDDYIINFNQEKDRIIEIKSGQVIYKIKINDIILIEKKDSRTIIYTATNMIQCSENLEKISCMLDEESFIRCHKSFICNKKYISEVRLKTGEIIFETGHSCLLGRKYRKGFQNEF